MPFFHVYLLKKTSGNRKNVGIHSNWITLQITVILAIGKDEIQL